MKISKFITNITINDNDYPGQIINLNVHHISGGYVGIDTNYLDEVANYITNPYEAPDFVQLRDSSDDKLDPPLNEHLMVGLMKTVVALDEIVQSLDSLQRLTLKAKFFGQKKLSLDEYEIFVGMARNFLDEIESMPKK